MEALIALVVLVLLAIPLLLVVALVMIAGLRRRAAALEAPWLPRRPPGRLQPSLRRNGLRPCLWPAPIRRSCGRWQPPHRLRPSQRRCAKRCLRQWRRRARSHHRRCHPRRCSRRCPRTGTPNFIERGIGAVKRWFTEGNVPVKIGMLVLLAGVAALLKYVSDQGWLVLPIELRLAGVTVGALGLLAFGWHQRERRRLFALALQGGAIGVLLLTIFAAFKRFELLNPGLPSPVRSRWWPACACWRWCRTRARWRCWASSPASWHRCGCPPAVATTWGCSATTRCSTLASSPSPGSVRGVR